MSDYPLATVAALALSPQQRILIVKTHKWKGSWGVPGGKIDYGESIKAAVIREFREETGLVLTGVHWGPVQEAVESPEFYKPAHFILLNFLARASSEEVSLNDEAQDFRWLEPETALRYELNSPTRKLIEFYLKNGFSTEPL